MSKSVTILITVIALLIAGFVGYQMLFTRTGYELKASPDLKKKIAGSENLQRVWTDQGINWGDLAANARRHLTSLPDNEEGKAWWDANGEQILAFFKGLNVYPSGWNAYLLSEDLKNFLAAETGLSRATVATGQFL